MHKNEEVDGTNGESVKDKKLAMSHLILVIDVNFLIWSQGLKIKFDKNNIKTVKLSQFLKSVFQFARFYCFMSSSERICIIATCSGNSKIIYENYISYTKNNLTENDYCTNAYEKLINFIKDNNNNSKTYEMVESTLSSALAIALCYNNRICNLYENINSRIFLLDISKSHFYTNQYTQLMNIAYNAKRNNIIIDVFSLNHKTQILEQICNITNGLYIDNSIFLSINCADNVEDILTQTIMFWFLPSTHSRKYFSNTYLNEDTNIAVCTCHNKQIDIAYICSCCLAIYCSEKDAQTNKERISCSVCKTRFTKSLLRNKTVSDLNFTTI
ncbi:RNA polymerase II transcription factor B subunit 4, putative [Plasmodium berghei]|uniref:RNA polymerase II transcription factor B subunit 4, putative n=2 Tax=Plasmodium berghei TaxID=5821 RepID=A0A509AL40_PLABA|nr:RNA polymerase II transcription factor B subunit 4, putative [Plasmodium berghei ANKA]CXI66356.1 RNA polymerase II transcription factor B subunit 4, putative [Plasmodium berghei]SCM24032.1 RNA polymerase II transcription factor B subunit 4, putative [Plasmodium berghei]SCN26892.1 RNA polymerase II transcription factor B subunit 4, putative [Plasmodium berghei]SCO61304.1 RNA polymerase II transcription factor B subunit 4, putative [Plasmodium berghei]SCO63313.1 RNA polymerase II transcriptio|eukprot:XP_034422508.1 RNA polymerase II transcription factor B subunit 4, putative [Plasmodium berghei ANKA]